MHTGLIVYSKATTTGVVFSVGLVMTTASQEAQHLKDVVVSVLDEHSASNIVEINVSGRCSFTEYMVIASGNSPNHVKALVEYVKSKMPNKQRLRVEGLRNKNWVIVNLDNVIVHIFMPDVRAYYDLEGLWSSPAEEGCPS